MRHPQWCRSRYIFPPFDKISLTATLSFVYVQCFLVISEWTIPWSCPSLPPSFVPFMEFPVPRLWALHWYTCISSPFVLHFRTLRVTSTLILYYVKPKVLLERSIDCRLTILCRIPRNITTAPVPQSWGLTLPSLPHRKAPQSGKLPILLLLPTRATAIELTTQTCLTFISIFCVTGAHGIQDVFP